MGYNISTVLGVAQWYSFFKRLEDSSFRFTHPIHFDKRYPDLVRIAKRVNMIGADPKRYILSGFKFKKGIELGFFLTEEAELAWKDYNFDFDREVKTQEVYLNQGMQVISSPEEVCLLGTLPFKAWFRLQYIQGEPSTELIQQAVKELELPARREGIKESHYSLDKIDRWGDKIIA